MIDTAEIYKTKEWKDIVHSIWMIALIVTSPHYYPWSDGYYSSWVNQFDKSARVLEERYGVNYRIRKTFGFPNYIGIANEKFDWIFKIPLTSR